MKKAPDPGTSSNEEEATILQILWNAEDNELFHTLTKEIITGLVLK
jgi:hypothetical protein